MKFDVIIFWVLIIVFLISFFGFCFYSIYSIFDRFYKIYIFERDNYSLEQAKLKAKLIDNFVTFNFWGIPNYSLIYEFSNNTIREYSVNADLYYQSLIVSNERSEDYEL